MSLSDKKHRARCECKLCGERLELVYKQEDVKQFIKELKEKIGFFSTSDEIANLMASSDECPIRTISMLEVFNTIDNLAGEDFI